MGWYAPLTSHRMGLAELPQLGLTHVSKEPVSGASVTVCGGSPSSTFWRQFFLSVLIPPFCPFLWIRGSLKGGWVHRGLMGSWTYSQ